MCLAIIQRFTLWWVSDEAIFSMLNFPHFIQVWNSSVFFICLSWDTLTLNSIPEGIHTEDYFLPWHRWYMLAFENMIREVDCRVTIPYWDWAFWSNVSWKNNIHIWNSHDYGLGGNGDPEKGYCVQDGPFKEGIFCWSSFQAFQRGFFLSQTQFRLVGWSSFDSFSHEHSYDKFCATSYT